MDISLEVLGEGYNAEKYSDLEIRFYSGSDMLGLIDEVSNFRIKYFRDYPYLYVGNMEYESDYISGFAKDPKSTLMVVKKKNNIVGVSTGMPFGNGVDILGDAIDLFASAGKDTSKYYYFGEIIFDYEHRGRGLCKVLLGMQENAAKMDGFKYGTLSTVIRESGDPRAPKSYASTDLVWSRLGYKKNNIFIRYEWPTVIGADTVANILNPMQFWEKEL